MLDLNEASDSGRHNDDNITNDSTPSLTMTSEDRTANPALFSHLLADNLIFRIFDRAETGAVGSQVLQPEALLYDSAAVLPGPDGVERVEPHAGGAGRRHP